MHSIKKFLIKLLAAAVLSAGLNIPAEVNSAAAECTDNFCPIPTVDEHNQPVYAIVSPVGYHAVEMIEQAPRLDTLNGKRIALVGGSFMADVTHDELRSCILEAYPDAQLFMFDEAIIIEYHLNDKIRP